MSRELRQNIIGLLRVAGSDDGDLKSLLDARPRVWEASANWLHLSGIALPFWDRLHKCGAEGAIPRKLGEALALNLAHHRRRVEAMAHEFDSLNRMMESAAIEYAAWKGFALTPAYCPDAALRPSYDYDYLVSDRDWDRARGVLTSAGYVCKPDPGTRLRLTFFHRATPSRLTVAGGGLYTEALPRKVELHLSIWDGETSGISLGIPTGYLKRRVQRTWQGLSFYTLGEPEAFVFQAVHTFRHILHNWCRLGWLMEIAHFLESRSTDTPFWNALDDYLGANDQLREIVALVVLLAARLFHATLPPPVARQMLGAMRGPVALWVDRYGLSSALDNFSENKYSLFLHREFVRDDADWREIRRRRLLPLHRPNRVAGAVPTSYSPLPEKWKQGWYVVQRLIHHSMSGAGFAWESARWERMRRLCTDREVR